MSKHTYKLKKGNYYYASEDGKATPISPLDVRYNGTSLGLQLDLYQELDKKYTQLNQLLEYAIQSITATLLVNGINNTSEDLKSLVEDVRRLKTILPNKDYIEITYNDSGYVKSVEIIDGDVEELIARIPYDVGNQCYKFVDGVFILDKEEKEKRGIILWLMHL